MHNERCTSGSGRGQAKPVVVKLPRRACSTLPYIPLANGKWLYLAVWLDLWSRKVVGWYLADHMRDELVITALRRALLGRQPADGLILHSDRGGQYASKDFRKLLIGKYLQSMTGLAFQPGWRVLR